MRPTPLLLRPDNFTPPTRTPWGGTKILSRYKAALELAPDRRAYTCVGESWEVSVEPDFPSVTDETGRPARPLAEVLAADPVAWLGREHAERYGGSTPILVKLLDAADDLSVQIHPSDDYAGLAAGEAGKPESWLVLEAEPGAGLYLGLSQGVRRQDVAEALERAGDLTPMLTFVPVEPGDFFVIDAGTVHAIGRGVTLIEPQFVLPGRRGVTYRFWDWNRRYDAQGRLDPSGQPRALHVEHALAVTAWDAPRGEAFVAEIRRPASRTAGGTARHEALARTRFLRVDRLHGEGKLALTTDDRLVALTVARGSVRVATPGGAELLRVPRGRSAVLPAALGPVEVVLAAEGDDVTAEACWVAAGP